MQNRILIGKRKEVTTGGVLGYRKRGGETGKGGDTCLGLLVVPRPKERTTKLLNLGICTVSVHLFFHRRRRGKRGEITSRGHGGEKTLCDHCLKSLCSIGFCNLISSVIIGKEVDFQFNQPPPKPFVEGLIGGEGKKRKGKKPYA